MIPVENNDPSVNHSTLGQNHLALPVGTRLAEFEITGLVGVGGFGIVYLAHDHSLGRQVALKEYMPSSLAQRTDGITVSARSGRNAETFTASLKGFINEARMLALFDHPALVKVYRFWEANGTAYMVMPYYTGQTLKKTLAQMPAPPSEAWLKQLLAPLLDGLEIVHAQHCFHRDIAPDNIFLLFTGQPVLLDFGAARQVIGDMGSSLTVILKPGYAPIEQYAGDIHMPQGAWTDIYALGAVLHDAITGAPPIAAVGRLIKDSYVPLQQACAGRYSAGFLAAIDQALAVRMEQRPQTIADFRTLLGVGAASVAAPEPASPPASLRVAQVRQAGAGRGLAVWAGAAAALLILAAGIIFFMNREESQPLAAPPAAAVAASAAASVAAPAAPVAFDPQTLLDRVQQHSDVAHGVRVDVDKPRLTIGRDNFRFGVQSAKGGYVYVLMLGTQHELTLLFPNALDSNNQIKAGQKLVLPGDRWVLQAQGPQGSNHLVAMVSTQPRDFSAAGLKKGDYFSEFSMSVLHQQFLAGPTGANSLAGVARCPAPPTPAGCSAAYGAVQFVIEEVATP